ncbi:hypothetical protein EMIT0P201_12451 [Pseudomonas chlororaphis]
MIGQSAWVVAISTTRMWKSGAKDVQPSQQARVPHGTGELVLWRLCVGHLRVRRIPLAPVFHTYARLPPLMWK